MFGEISLLHGGVAFGMTAAFCVLINRLRFVDFAGCTLTLVLVSAIGSRGLVPLVFALAMYAVVIVMTAYKSGQKHEISGGTSHGGRPRGVLNVIGKVTAPALFALTGQDCAFAATISFGIADGAASEIGILSKSRPRLVTTWKPVAPGTNGAVSWLGTLAMTTTACMVGMLGWISVSGVSDGWHLFVAGLLGVPGALLDSLLGAVFENRGYLTGWEVNLFSSLVSGLLAWAIVP